MGRTIIVSSGKGGTGKTMFSVNMGAVLSNQGHKTLIIDMDMGLRNTDLYLGMENNVVYNTVDALTGICRVKKAVLKVGGFENLYFMAASPNVDDVNFTSLHIKILTEKLKEYFDFVILDCPAGIGDFVDMAVSAADKVVIVTEPEIAALRDADVTERYFMTKGLRDIFMVVNKMRKEFVDRGFTPDIDTISGMFKAKVAGIIQFDENIHISTLLGIPIAGQEGTEAEVEIKKAVKKILENL